MHWFMNTVFQKNLRYVYMMLHVLKGLSSQYVRLLFAISGLFVCKILNPESLILLKMTMIPNLNCSARNPQKQMNLMMDSNQTRGTSNGLA